MVRTRFVKLHATDEYEANGNFFTFYDHEMRKYNDRFIVGGIVRDKDKRFFTKYLNHLYHAFS